MKKDKFGIQGFKASVIAAGIKKDKSLDMALIVSETEASAAGVFTTNKVKAAPVIFSMECLRNGKARAIIANSGNANACTGKNGINDARTTAELVAAEVGINPREVLVASTGVIGSPMDMTIFRRAVPKLAKKLSYNGIPRAAEAIMTTDSFPKLRTFHGIAGKKPYRITGIAKGAGMIMPDMATMLCFILTDLNIKPKDLRAALSEAVEASFNRITVDGDTSTNDTVLVLANGMAENKNPGDADFREFQKGLQQVMTDLAQMIVKDGEGATKVVNIRLRGAERRNDALKAIRNIANSSLVKTAFYGQDPNWGRIMAAIGRSDISMNEEKVEIWIDDIKIVDNGLAVGKEAERRAAERMKNEKFSLTINLNVGKYEEEYSTCDLTHEYVSINADYRT
ncbi:MAG: bifunctional glutamate N-acetyltransferase/amino-acid acetyltransferase ArgJ [Deltaproteobacteria bacterium]|nr:bifunctional glutamate N-acetyltransferase/amino-acid acetyltransferase ArgJ [Deltaproteobacteria bacterium]